MFLRSRVWAKTGKYTQTHSVCTHLNGIFFHSNWTIHVVQFVVKAACIADWLTDLIATPQRCLSGLTIWAKQSIASRCTLKDLNWKLVGCYRKRAIKRRIQQIIFQILWTCLQFIQNEKKISSQKTVITVANSKCLRSHILRRRKQIVVSFSFSFWTYQASVGLFFGGSWRSCILIKLIRRVCTAFIEIPALFGSHCNKQLQKQ